MGNASRTVSIADFGAVAGDRPQTAAIQQAIDHVHQAGGGTVAVPTGRFTTGGLMLRSNVTLWLRCGATLAGSRELADYVTPDAATASEADLAPGAYNPHSRWNSAILKACDAENIAIIGEEGSTLDGQNAYDPQGEENFRGPHAIGIHRCRNVTFRGYTVVNSANWAHTVFYSENITAENLRVLGGHDGVHFRRCDNVLVRNCLFETGDDCVAGFANRNVVIQNCRINTSCSGLRFGGTNVLVEDCHFYGPGKWPHRVRMPQEDKAAGVNGSPENWPHRPWTLSAITYFCDLSLPVTARPGNFVVRNCRVENVDKFLHYNFSGNEQWQGGSPLEDIHFENVEISGVLGPCVVYADAKVPLVLTMDNVTFRLADGAENAGFMQAAHFKFIRLKNVTLPNAAAPLIKTWSEGPGKIVFDNVTTPVPESKRIVMASEPFFSKPI